MKDIIKDMIKSRFNDDFFEFVANILEDSLEIDATTPTKVATDKIIIFCNTMLRSAMTNADAAQKIYKWMYEPKSSNITQAIPSEMMR